MSAYEYLRESCGERKQKNAVPFRRTPDPHPFQKKGSTRAQRSRWDVRNPSYRPVNALIAHQTESGSQYCE